MIAHRAHNKLSRSKMRSRNSKPKLYGSLIRNILTYGPKKTCTMSTEARTPLKMFESKIVRKIQVLEKEDEL